MRALRGLTDSLTSGKRDGAPSVITSRPRRKRQRNDRSSQSPSQADATDSSSPSSDHNNQHTINNQNDPAESSSLPPPKVSFRTMGTNQLHQGELSTLSGLSDLGVVALGADQLETSLLQQAQDYTQEKLTDNHHHADVVKEEEAHIAKLQHMSQKKRKTKNLNLIAMDNVMIEYLMQINICRTQLGITGDDESPADAATNGNDDAAAAEEEEDAASSSSSSSSSSSLSSFQLEMLTAKVKKKFTESSRYLLISLGMLLTYCFHFFNIVLFQLEILKVMIKEEEEIEKTRNPPPSSSLRRTSSGSTDPVVMPYSLPSEQMLAEWDLKSNGKRIPKSLRKKIEKAQKIEKMKYGEVKEAPIFANISSLLLNVRFDTCTLLFHIVYFSLLLFILTLEECADSSSGWW